MQITHFLTRGWHNIQVFHNIPNPRIQRNWRVGQLWRQEVEKWNTKIAEQMLFSCNIPDLLSATHESEWNNLTKRRLYQAVYKESSETPVFWFKTTLIEKFNIVTIVYNFTALFSFTNFRRFSLFFGAPSKVMSRCTRHPKERAVPGFCCRQCFGTSFSGRWAALQWGSMKFSPLSNHLPSFPLPK